MERFTNDCIRMAEESKNNDDLLLPLGLNKKQEMTAQELQKSLNVSLQRLRSGIEFILLMRRRVARLALELAKSTNKYDLQAGEATLKAELDKCDMHEPSLPLDAILADLNRKYRN
jgi:hypothetical protein